MFIVPSRRTAELPRTSRADSTPIPTPPSPSIDASQFATGDLMPAQLTRLGATPVATTADATRIGSVPAASLTNVTDPSRSLSQAIGRTSVPPGSVAIVLPDGSRHPQNEQHYSTLDDVRRAVDALRNAGLGDFSQDVRAENVMGLSAPAGVEQYTIRGANVGLILASIANGNARGVGLDLQQQGAGGWATTAENTGARRVAV